MPNKPGLDLISLAAGRPFVLINNQTLAPGESASIRVGTTNVVVRCLTIGARYARVRIVESGEEFELQLSPGQ